MTETQEKIKKEITRYNQELIKEKKLAKLNSAYHKKQMEYYDKELKIIEETILELYHN